MARRNGSRLPRLVSFLIIVEIACGNGVIDSDAEQCDDGNKESYDGCSSDCKLERYFNCTQNAFLPKTLCRRTAVLGRHHNTYSHSLSPQNDDNSTNGSSSVSTPSPSSSAQSCFAPLHKSKTILMRRQRKLKKSLRESLPRNWKRREKKHAKDRPKNATKRACGHKEFKRNSTGKHERIGRLSQLRISDLPEYVQCLLCFDCNKFLFNLFVSRSQVVSLSERLNCFLLCERIRIKKGKKCKRC